MQKLSRTAHITLLIFFFSGISGLVYETVWLRMLTRVLGSTVYATSVTLSAFMAGLALGSYFLGRFSLARRDLMKLYALMEAGIGLSALVMLWLIPASVHANRWLFVLTNGSRGSLTFAQSVTMFALLLVPTALMGGTLPVLAGASRFFDTSLARRMGLLYGLNTLGAVAGVLLSGLFTLGSLGESGTVFIGVAINFLVAFTALRLPKSGAEAAAAEPGAAGAAPAATGLRYRAWIPWLYALSGFVAIAYEVVWTRVFQIEIGTSIYAFSLMLAFYLIGISAGSLTGGRVLDRIRNPMTAFVVCQAFIALYGLAGIFLIPRFMPENNIITIFERNALLLPPLVVTPLTFALGFIFPALSRAYAVDPNRVSRDVGWLYALNTAGCILGSLVTGFVLLGWLGSRGTLLALSGANMALAWAGLAVGGVVALGRGRLFGLAVATVLAAVLAPRAPDPFLSAMDKDLARRGGIPGQRWTVLYHRESAHATTTAFIFPRPVQPLKQLWVNGIGMTHLCTETKIMAHLPILSHPDPKRLLVICFGMGTSLRSASRYPGLECDAVELDPQVLDCFEYFHDDAAAVRANPRVRLIADDGRNFLLARDTRWDIITMDPPPPSWSAGTVNIQSREFFQLCRDHLNPHGLMCLWVPPMAASEAKLILATYHSVFPATRVYKGPFFQGLDLLGSVDAEASSAEVFRARATDPALAAIARADLTEWDQLVPDPTALEQLQILGPKQFGAFTAGTDVITDDRPFSEFPLWRSHYDSEFRYCLDGDLLALWRDLVYSRRNAAPAPGK